MAFAAFFRQRMCGSHLRNHMAPASGACYRFFRNISGSIAGNIHGWNVPGQSAAASCDFTQVSSAARLCFSGTRHRTFWDCGSIRDAPYCRVLHEHTLAWNICTCADCRSVSAAASDSYGSDTSSRSQICRIDA